MPIRITPQAFALAAALGHESKQMVKALQARGVDVAYMVKDNEGHGFRNEENQFDFYEAMDKFLAKYLQTS
jgi:dipeptidyl aminopeptidase/acylaminoacyl peptidase